MILVDTREKKNGAVEKYFAANKIDFDRTKLYVGDYMLPGGAVSVDRKRNLAEWAGCLYSGRKRFLSEVLRAQRAGINLVILIEHGQGIQSIKDIRKWENPLLKDYPNAVTGRALMDETYKLHISYGVPILFCSKADTGAEIVKILSEKD